MRTRIHLAAGLYISLLIGGGSAGAQQQLGTPVDRNVSDTGANAASQRAVQPGIGQFGVGSLLLDRFGGAYEPTRHDGYHDPRVNQRYLLKSQGIHALIGRPDYIGPSPQGGWVRNGQTYDGAEVLTMTAANTVYVLSPELLHAPAPVRPAYNDSPSRVQPTTVGDPYALMREAQVTGQSDPRTIQPVHQRPPTYRHPEIIERQRKLREERAAEQDTQAETDTPDADNQAEQDSQHKPEASAATATEAAED